MKISKTSTKKTNFLKLKFLKNHITTKKTIEIVTRLKKALNVIFKYHINDKRILFVGSPNKKLLYTLKRTKHIFIPQTIWIEGILTNSKSFFNGLIQKSNVAKNRQKFHTFAKLNKTIDLIVILNEHHKQKIAEEASKAQIVTISYNCEFNIFNKKPDFKIPNKNNKLSNNFFYALLIAIFYKLSKIPKISKLKLKKNYKPFKLLPAKYFKHIKKLF